MPSLIDASPAISVRLYKAISRKTVDGQSAVSARYQGKEEFIDLTPFLADGSAVRTSRSVREPAGAFSISFADRPQNSATGAFASLSATALESIYGLVEPMDMVEIRMWSGVGTRPAKLPIKMRGFVTEVQRSQTMGQDGRPQRQVVISGQDYGKIWQMYQVIYLQAYSEGTPLLTTYKLAELFGFKAENVMKAGEFVQQTIDKVINPFLQKFMPENLPEGSMPKQIKTDIKVKYGMVNLSMHEMQGGVYEFLKFHGDVGIWNELYIEDREDGVYAVYRPTPALKITQKEGEKDRKIQDDAPDPVIVDIPDRWIRSISSARTDAVVFNFFWVRNARFDLIDDQTRKLMSISAQNETVSLKDYPNAAQKYYGTRPLYAETQQGGDGITNMTSGLPGKENEDRGKLQEAWIDKRRRLMVEMNKDNVVLERGSASIKGGPTRSDGEAMKPGDYARFKTGNIEFLAYVTQIDDEFMPFQAYTTTLSYERGEGFVTRARMEGGAASPWLAEQASVRGLV